MSTIKAEVRKDCLRRYCTYNVKIKLSHRSKVIRFNTDLFVTINELNNDFTFKLNTPKYLEIVKLQDIYKIV